MVAQIFKIFREHGGAVLSTIFDKYCYVTVRHMPRFFDYSTGLSYSTIERVNNIEDIACYLPVYHTLCLMLEDRFFGAEYLKTTEARTYAKENLDDCNKAILAGFVG